jgi:phthalate 4,5-dioxygenase oxygenase subunit
VPLTKEENEILTQVGPETPMGKVLRRYWTPACLSVELAEPETSLRVRLLGEDLVAFRDTDGKIGLVDEHCPHRGASLYYGRNEDCGLRCVYHGWKFDTEGNCLDMPSEQRGFAAQIHLTAYPTHEVGGIVWTYMGPKESMTPFRDFGWSTLPEEEVRATKVYTPCNWVQVLDGNYDTAHISFLHMANTFNEDPRDDTDRPGYPSSIMASQLHSLDGAPALDFQEDWYGFRYVGLRKTPNGFINARTNTWVFPYTTQVASIPFTTRQIWVVPIDDHHSWRYNSTPQSPRFENPGGVADASIFAMDRYAYERQTLRFGIIPRKYTMENEYGIDRSVQKDLSVNGTYTGIADLVSHDFMVTETMGPIYDRTKENLGTTDLAIIRMHQMLLDAAQDLVDGKEELLPALGTDHDFRSVRAAEKILAPDEDWRILGTDDDPIVQQSMMERQAAGEAY